MPQAEEVNVCEDQGVGKILRVRAIGSTVLLGLKLRARPAWLSG